MKPLWVVAAWTLSGCGLTLDLGPARLDAGVRDSGFVADASDAEVRPECSEQTFDFGTIGPFPGTFFDSQRCDQVVFSFSGDPAEGAPRIQPAFVSGDPGLFLAAAGGRFIEFTWSFPNVVAEFNLAFEFLSFAPLRDFDERLEVFLDGDGVTPELREMTDVFVSGDEVRATSTTGQGVITIRNFRTVTLRLTNVTRTNGRGIDVVSIQYRYADME